MGWSIETWFSVQIWQIPAIPSKVFGYLTLTLSPLRWGIRNMIFANSLIVCAVLALDSWNYYSGEQAQHTQHCPIFFIQLNYVHNNIRNKVLPPYVKLPCHKVALEIPLPLNQWSHSRQTLRGRCWACSPEQYFQLSSANTAQTLWELFRQYWGDLWPDSPTCAWLNISQCLTPTMRRPTHWGPAQHTM